VPQVRSHLLNNIICAAREDDLIEPAITGPSSE